MSEQNSPQGVVNLTFSQDGAVATLMLGPSDERSIVLTETRLNSFSAALDQVRERGVKGLIITGPSLEMFSVGADIDVIGSVTSAELGEQLARQGQLIYDKLEQLNCLTIAAISGPCVGGGCEMVLACNVRIISDNKGSVIGLPETKLGILPGFGGTQRLPRLVGLPKALDVILAGKTLRPEQAKKIGLVNMVTPAKDLLSTAEGIARGTIKTQKPKLKFLDTLLTKTGPGRAFVKSKAAKSLQEQTKGFYPAPVAALDTTVAGLGMSQTEGLKREARELGRLITTPESKALVHLYHLTEASKSLGKSAKKEVEEFNLMVVGAGIMGAGIAGTFAKNGHSVILKDTTEEALKRGRAHIEKELSKQRYLKSKDRAAIGSRIEYISFNSHSIKRTDLVVEAVFEDLSLKQKILGDLASKMSSKAVLATNTSSLPITNIAQTIPNPERVIGMHFFNPVEKMPLVEIVRGKETSDSAVALVAALSSRIGKFPIVVNDVPGFLVNRILVPYLNEAAFLLEEGYSVKEIDDAALAFGMPMGPIRLLDEVGLDVASHVSKIMIAGYGDRMRAPNFSEKMVAAGRLGRKSNAGFYDFDGKKAEVTPKLSELLGLSQKTPAQKLSQSALQDRLILHLVNEAWKCFEEGVAGSDQALAEKQIDLGTVMGIGFPPFLGGVMFYSRKRGVDKISVALGELEKQFGMRYQVAKGLRAS